MEFIEAVIKLIGVVLLWFAIAFCIAAVATFCVMMGVAGLHEWWNVIPTMGFWEAFKPTVWFAVPLAMYTAHSARSSD
jgi:hypothetical protein